MKSFKQYVDVSEAIDYHTVNQIPLSENVYRIHSDGFYQFFIEAKKRYNDGSLIVEDAFDRQLLESDIGEFGLYEVDEVPLDAPFIAEEDEKVEIGKPKRGGPKKFYVYVRDGDKVKKVTFGDKGGAADGSTLTSKITNPKARASYAARHKCSTQNDRTSAAYWSCRLPYYAKSLGLSGGGKFFW
jgi:hypothetical protein